MFSDLGYALRQLTKSPGFTAIAVLMLALGIGANSAFFSVMDQLLYQPLPVPEPERLAVLAATSPDGRQFLSDFNYPLFGDYQRGNTVFENLSATAPLAVGVGADSGTERRQALLVSGNYFSMLHVDAALGRTFDPGEGVVIDDAAVVVLGHGFWVSQFGGKPDVIGQTIKLNAHAFTVIGVAPREFSGTTRGQHPDLYVPITMYGQLVSGRPGGEHPLKSRYYTWHSIIGRLRPGVTHEQAQSAMQTLTSQNRAITPDNTPEKLSVLAGAQGIVEEAGSARRPLHLLLAISGLVLLITCANLANLQLARASGRAREFAVRIALGANRARLLRGLLIESVLLSLCGGALGLLVATWLTSLLQQFQLPSQSFALTGEIDLRVLSFTGAVSLLTGIAFGLAPAWQASRTQPVTELKNGAGAEARGWRRTVRGSLVVMQIALSLVVLISAGLFTRTLAGLQRVDPGFEPSRVVMLSLDLGLNHYDGVQSTSFYANLLERVRGLPGVEAASLSAASPLSGQTPGVGFRRVEDLEPKVGEHPWADVNFVSSDYFRTLGVRLLQGRDFNAGDTATSRKVAIVDEAFIQRYRGGKMSVGWHIYFGGNDAGHNDEPVEIVGIVSCVHSRSLNDAPLRILFFPTVQNPQLDLTLTVRTGIEPAAAIGTLRELVKSLDANVPVFHVRTLEQQLSGSLAFQRLTTTLLNGFSLLTLLLVALGLYGVLAYSVSRCTREIGVRMALGAQIADIIRLVLQQGFSLVAWGVVLGLGGAVATATVLRSQLYGISPFDPAVFVAAALLLSLVSLLACYLPARRATKVDPMIALRSE